MGGSTAARTASPRMGGLRRSNMGTVQEFAPPPPQFWGESACIGRLCNLKANYRKDVPPKVGGLGGRFVIDCKAAYRLWTIILILALGIGGAVGAWGQVAPPGEAKPGNPGQPPPGPGGLPVMGDVVAVRGKVLQMRAMGASGLTRVIITDGAMITRDETCPLDVLKSGMKVSGTGRQVEGTGVGSVPLQVELLSLRVGPSMGMPFNFGGGTGPLMRGRSEDVFRKQTYQGTISFDAVVKSVTPLVLTDPQGQPLSLRLHDPIEVVRQGTRRIKEDDITAGARLMAFGERAPDGLLNARMVMFMGQGSERTSVSGTIRAVSTNSVSVRSAFAPNETNVTVDPAAKFYFQERLDLDTIRVGDTLAFTGRLFDGTTAAPKTIIVRTITPAAEEAPKLEESGMAAAMAPRSVTVMVKGKILALDPLRIRTAEGQEVLIKVPGQVAYVRYRLLKRSDVKVGQKALIMGNTTETGFVADVIVLNPSLALWFPAR